MGMTIDEALKILDNIPTIGEQVDALEMAIETMRKYQKIEEAYTKYQNDVVTNIYADKKFVEALEGIFKNGNDD